MTADRDSKLPIIARHLARVGELEHELEDLKAKLARLDLDLKARDTENATLKHDLVDVTNDRAKVPILSLIVLAVTHPSLFHITGIG